VSLVGININIDLNYRGGTKDENDIRDINLYCFSNNYIFIKGVTKDENYIRGINLYYCNDIYLFVICSWE
jgi:hypothetical protein